MSHAAIKLYGFPLSGHSHRVELMLSLLGLPTEFILVDLAQGAHKSADFLATINSFGEVPAIDDNGTVLADSNAILVYLASKYGNGQWLPSDPVGQARVQRWLSAAAGVLGPVLVNYLREYQLSIGVPRAAAYDITLYILAGLLVLGFLCNLLVRPVADKYFMTDAQLAAEQALGHDKGADATTSLEWSAAPGSMPMVIAAWLAVGIPLLWGVWVTVQKTAVLFH